MFRPALRSSVRVRKHQSALTNVNLQTRLLRGTTPASFLAGRLATYRFLSQEVRSQIQKAVESTPVVLFMKGTPDEPQCGFSRAAIQVLELQGVPPEKLKTYNVLADQELRQGIKEFSCVISCACYVLQMFIDCFVLH